MGRLYGQHFKNKHQNTHSNVLVCALFLVWKVIVCKSNHKCIFDVKHLVLQAKWISSKIMEYWRPLGRVKQAV